jgi:glucose/arabinose dehydrogenase
MQKALFLFAAILLAFNLGHTQTVPAIPTGVTFATLYDTTKTSFDQPIYVGGVPKQADKLIVVERSGGAYHLDKTGDTYVKSLWFKIDADTTTHWDGFWEVLFHPDFPAKPLFYVMYRLKTGDRSSVIEEWKCDGASMLNPSKSRTIIQFPQLKIHSSGDMHFGPDGYLYTSQADRDQPSATAGGQDKGQLWGKMLRIDINNKDTGLEYAIPPTNPFVGQAAYRAEIWALGFRVPWRFSFDSKTGDIYEGDVGISTYEEINIVGKGLNYGYGLIEGPCSEANCTPYTDPIWALTRSEAACVIGGSVYRADSTSAFNGVYIFGDYQNKKLYGLRLNATKKGVTEKKSISNAVPGMISSIGQDAVGNFFVTCYTELGTLAARKNHVYRLQHAELKAAATAIGNKPERKRVSMSRTHVTGLPNFTVKAEFKSHIVKPDGRRFPTK